MRWTEQDAPLPQRGATAAQAAQHGGEEEPADESQMAKRSVLVSALTIVVRLRRETFEENVGKM